MKIAICDDEPIYIETTSSLLQKWAGEHGIEMQIFTYDNGDDLIAAHTDECMDLILLDVIMPLLNAPVPECGKDRWFLCQSNH